MLESSHSETTYKTAVVQTTWQKEAMAILKRVVATRKHGMQYAEPFLTPVDPATYVRTSWWHTYSTQAVGTLAVAHWL